MSTPIEAQKTRSNGSLDASLEKGHVAAGHATGPIEDDLALIAMQLDAKAHATTTSLDGTGVAPFTPEEFKRVLHKIDWIMMPMMSCVYILTFLDKTTTNYAHLLKFQDDLSFSGSQYSWLGSIFYFGYLFATPVHGFFFQKLHLGRYLAGCILVWGITLGLHAACFNYASLVVCRLFLGIFESAITPGFILITGRFYARREQVARTGIWFSMNGWAQVLGGLVAYGVLQQPAGPLATWREMFIILGCVTCLLGIIVLFFFPSSPEAFKLLTPRERLIAVERVRDNKTGLHDRETKAYQIKEAFADPRLYLFCGCIFLLDIANGAASNFGSAIISSLQYDQKITALLGLAPGISEVVGCLVVVLGERWTRTRGPPGVFALIVAIVGLAMMVGLPVSQKESRMAGYSMSFWFALASLMLYATLSSAVAGETKKIVFNSMFQIFYSAGNIVGPQTFKASEAPDYPTGKISMLACITGALVLYSALYSYHFWENRRRDRKYGKVQPSRDHDAAEDLSDLTDRERTDFRYPI